jgi:hypothetical protein
LRLFTERLLKRNHFQWPAPLPATPPTSTESKQLQLISRTEKRPLNIIVYTRGNSGKGRTMRQEELIVKALQEKGANAFLCCNFGNTSLEQQLYYAYNADVIMGLHGAAITHGIFMKPGAITLEWKTLYGYDSILFALIADSRNGIHAQVDIRKYFVPGGHRPMDNLLIDRVVNILLDAIQLQQQLLSQATSKSVVGMSSLVNTSSVKNQNDLCFHEMMLKSQSKSAFPGDLIIGPQCVPKEINHLLGPFQTNQNQICKELIFQQLRNKLGKTDHSFHCDICTKYVL